MNSLKVAVVGAGYFAQLHHEAWTRMDRVELVGICDTNAEAAEAAAQANGVAAYSDVADMLAAARPDLVDIVTPPPSHLELIRTCMDERTAVICQKPFCQTPEEASEAVALSQKAGCFIAVHENFRFQPWYRKARHLLDENALGQVYQITYRLRPGDGQGPDAYLARQPYFQKMPKLLIHETGVHWIDTFRYLFGDPTAVFADLRRLNPVIAGEDAGIVIFDLPDGVRGVLDGNRLADHAADNTRRTMGEMLIEGADATLRLSGQGELWLRSHGSMTETQVPCDFVDTVFGGDCVYNLCAHVADHMLDGTGLENEASDYLVVQAAERAAYQSTEKRCWIDVASCL
ncbi:Gfo/Idh/MocA family oxidoreductase [Anderseniella sp. Alg231-50]|uniref:Gfo/Idh/MocA family oxidoreductase n=1 Tax=Anderseniella sp. Alg231-50 TaxID=1922226 RepID=UPI000D5599F8